MTKHCGYVALVGRPNVGKSTLINALLGRKHCITSEKPQTTRYRLLGVDTKDPYQMLLVDTPGIHSQAPRQLNKRMNQVGYASIHDVDVIVLVVEALGWQDDDTRILNRLQCAQVPVVVAVNKIDKLAQKTQLLPYLEGLKNNDHIHVVVPISARKNQHVGGLKQVLWSYLPQGDFVFPEGQHTDVSMEFLMCEIIREKLTRALHHELPYAIAVEMEHFEKAGALYRMSAIIWVETSGQKGIVIGSRGQLLKHVGQKARKDMERLLGAQVFLSLWVKEKQGWPDDDRMFNHPHIS